MKFNFKAFGIHFLFSILLVSLFALVILTLWYPSIWSKALGGYDLFIKIVIIDLIVGPLCMGIVYKSHKSFKERIVDATTILVFQLAFMGYGLWVLYESRPVFIVFAQDRYDVYVANEIEPEMLGDQAPFDRLSLTGPVYGAVDLASISSDTLFDLTVSGLDVSNFPKYYTPIEDFKETISARKVSYQEMDDTLLKSALTAYIDKNKLDERAVYWLPVKHRFGFVTAVLVGDEWIPHGYIDLDSYETNHSRD